MQDIYIYALTYSNDNYLFITFHNILNHVFVLLKTKRIMKQLYKNIQNKQKAKKITGK